MLDVEGTVLEIIAQKAKVERNTLGRATELSDLVLDSLDIIEIVFQIDDTFDISLMYNANKSSSAVGGGIKTGGDLIDLVMAQVSQRDGHPAA